jgi:hypothetical protein
MSKRWNLDGLRHSARERQEIPKIVRPRKKSPTPPGDGGLREALGQDQPWSCVEVLRRLAKEAEPGDKDFHGHEEVTIACKRAREIADKLDAALGRPAETQGVPCPRCDGQGHNYFVVTGETFECTLCNGQGTVPPAPSETMK